MEVPHHGIAQEYHEEQDLTPVVLAFRDGNHDGRVDMLVNVQDSPFVFLSEEWHLCACVAEVLKEVAREERAYPWSLSRMRPGKRRVSE